MGNIQKYDVQIIIPTLASESRFDSLKKAIKSVLSQEDLSVCVVVVVNGLKSYSPVISWLKSQNNLIFIYEKIGSAPLAHLIGRKSINAPFFGFLDDDDILLPGALRNRYIEMINSDADVVVENGWKIDNGVKRICISSVPACEKNPQIELLKSNWLGSCSALYRTKTVTPDFFRDYAAYMEWTYVAFKLTLNYRIKFINSAGFEINKSSESLSQSREYSLGCVDTLRKMIAISQNKLVTSILKRKMTRSFHGLFNLMLSEGDIINAMIYYFRCVISPDGWRYWLNFPTIIIKSYLKKNG